MQQNQITFEGETLTEFDRSYLDFSQGFQDILELIFGGDNVQVDDLGHGGGVEFYGSFYINAEQSRVDAATAALIALTDNHGFAQLLVHAGPCSHDEVMGVLPL